MRGLTDVVFIGSVLLLIVIFFWLYENIWPVIVLWLIGAAVRVGLID